jgi:hypothetical protein
MHGRTNRRLIYTTTQDKNIIWKEAGLLNHCFQGVASWRLKEVPEVSTLRFLAETAGDRLLEPFFLPPSLSRNV